MLQMYADTLKWTNKYCKKCFHLLNHILLEPGAEAFTIYHLPFTIWPSGEKIPSFIYLSVFLYNAELDQK